MTTINAPLVHEILLEGIQLSCSHRLFLPYESPCNRLHGHNYQVSLMVAAPVLNDFGMVVDFTVIKRTLDQFDHTDLNESAVIAAQRYPHLGRPMPTTAECLGQLWALLIQEVINENTTNGAMVQWLTVKETEKSAYTFDASRGLALRRV